MSQPPLPVFQRLCIEWGRDGRTPALTARRRELPRCYPLPLSPLPAGVVALAQSVDWSDEDGFTHARETVLHHEQLATLHPAELELHPSEASEGLELVPTPHLGGTDFGGRLMLRRGQIARYEWNERLFDALGTYTGRVRHTVISVGLCPQPLSAQAFFKLPDFYVSHLVDLNERRWRKGRAG